MVAPGPVENITHENAPFIRTVVYVLGGGVEGTSRMKVWLRNMYGPFLVEPVTCSASSIPCLPVIFGLDEGYLQVTEEGKIGPDV